MRTGQSESISLLGKTPSHSAQDLQSFGRV